jgi:hypothetical protein
MWPPELVVRQGDSLCHLPLSVVSFDGEAVRRDELPRGRLSHGEAAAERGGGRSCCRRRDG